MVHLTHFSVETHNPRARNTAVCTVRCVRRSDFRSKTYPTAKSHSCTAWPVGLRFERPPSLTVSRTRSDFTFLSRLTFHDGQSRPCFCRMARRRTVAALSHCRNPILTTAGQRAVWRDYSDIHPLAGLDNQLLFLATREADKVSSCGADQSYLDYTPRISESPSCYTLSIAKRSAIDFESSMLLIALTHKFNTWITKTMLRDRIMSSL
jgi:hypothetical protein